MEGRLRSIAKAISFRILATAVTMVSLRVYRKHWQVPWVHLMW